jgi:hypothetical protein
MATVLRMLAAAHPPPDTTKIGEALELHREALDSAVEADPARARYLRAYAQTLMVQAQIVRDPAIAAEAEQMCYRAMRRAHPYDPLQQLLLPTAQQAQTVRGILM